MYFHTLRQLCAADFVVSLNLAATRALDPSVIASVCKQLEKLGVNMMTNSADWSVRL